MYVGGITDEMHNTYYKNNPTKLVEYYCNVRLKWWQIMLLGLLNLNKNEKLR